MFAPPPQLQSSLLSDLPPQKLQPFFPPLDQVQSLNLRAALLRSLEQAKKNGVLGRDVLIRKTMLDECKGERMEEVLAVFSSAVLKKLVAEQQLNCADHPALAQTLALENRGYSAQTTDLSILALAHRASLSRHLREKNDARARYSYFSELLDLKERALVRRREQAKALAAQERESEDEDEITDDVKRDIWRTVRNNWSGSERWMETLLHGDVHSRKDGLLSTPFDKVWRRVQAGRLTELEDHADGLLEQLDRRVRAQKARLEKWRTFRAATGGTVSNEGAEGEVQPSTQRRGVDLAFGAHESLLLGRLSPRKLPRSLPDQLNAEYSDIINGLQQDLVEASRPAAPTKFRGFRSRDKTEEQHLETPAEEAISEISELEEDDHVVSLDHDVAAKQPPQPPDMQMQPPHVSGERPPTSVSPSSAVRRPSTPVSRSPTRRTPSPRKASPPNISPPRASSPPASPPKPMEASPDKPLSPTQALADQILASMNAASPSPVKKPRHTVSLAERTRLSITRRNNSIGCTLEDDDDDEPDLSTLSIRSPPSVTISSAQPNRNAAKPSGALPTSVEEQPEDQRGYEDLVSRTRRSMVGFEAAKKKAQLERRRSQRQSSRLVPPTSGHRRDGSGSAHFPAVDEEAGDNTTLLLAEELMNNEQDDYEAIFKSRPKIKTSPVGSPVRAWEG